MKRHIKLLLLIFGLALLLRLLGITHGFPFIFHPDEPAVVREALALRFNKNPGHFDWPHFFIYLNYFLYMLFGKLRTFAEMLGLKGVLPGIIWDDNLIFYLLSRVFAATLGAATVFPIYLIGKKLFTEKAGFLAALVLSLVPFHAWHSHYALIDVPMVFWLSWSLYFSAKLYFESKPVNYVLAGLFAGFAASTKYHGAFALLAVIFAHVLRIQNSRDEKLISFKGLHLLGLSGMFSLVGFAATTPFSVFDFETFVRTDGPKGALWQFTNVGKVSLTTQFCQLVSNFLHKFPNDLSITFLVVYAASVIKVIKDRKLNVWVLLALPSLLLFFYISGFEKDRSHYFMVAYPFFVVLVGAMIAVLLTKFHRYAPLVATLVFALPLYLCIRNAYIFMQTDTRVILYDMLKDTPTGSIIVYDGGDLTEVMTIFPDETVTRYRTDKVIDFPANQTHYFIQSADDKSTSATVFDNAVIKATIPNKLRRGPSITIFEIL